jgi:hypothetical protein
MKLEYRCGMLCTEYGLELLERKPDFVQAVWENPANRLPWFRRDLTKIHYEQQLFIEKGGVDETELQKYAAMSLQLEKRGCEHIRIAKPYFFKEDRLLVEFLKNAYQFGGAANKRQASEDAKEEAWDILMMSFSMEWFVEENGDLVVLDPHCPIRGL